MPMSKVSDLLGVLKGARNVANALVKHQEDAIRYKITHSSLKNLPKQCIQTTGKKLNDIKPSKIPVSFCLYKL